MKKRLLIIIVAVTVMALSSIALMGFVPADGQSFKVMAKLMENPNTIKAALLNGQNADSGKAFILWDDGTLYHYAVASLPDPPEGMFYEGWLVHSSGEKFSTGKLTQDANGNYELAFWSDMAWEGYRTAVITMEKVMDDKPETVLLKGILEYREGLQVPINGELYYFTGAPVGTGDATDIPGHHWLITGDNMYMGVHHNSGPGGMAKWWSSDAGDGELLYVVKAIADKWTAEKAQKYADMGFIHYHEMASVKDGSLHPDMVVWLKHTAVTSFTLDGGPHPEFSHAVDPGVDLEFIPNGMKPYNP